MRHLVQLIPSHHRHDAAGSEVITIEKIMRESGWSVETYADNIDPELSGRTRQADELNSADVDGAVALYHYCAASLMTFRFVELDCPKVVIYHNITPHHFFEPYSPDIAIDCREGRKQLSVMTDAVDLAIGHSDYTRRELDEAGFDVTRTIPFLFDAKNLDVKTNPKMTKRLAGDPVVLFTGRFAPNKSPTDFIKAAGAYASLSGAPPARFVIVGKRNVIPAYTKEIDSLLDEFSLPEDKLLITDEVTQEELIAAYQSASLFLSLSRHEGFMVPLLECMTFGIPILALARAAVPETLGDAGILMETADPEKAAALVAEVLADETLRSEMADRGRRRLRRYNLEHWGFTFRLLLEALL